MRKRKSLKKDEDSEGSEPAGEPEEFQDSGEDWTPDADSVMLLSCFQHISCFNIFNVLLFN